MNIETDYLESFAQVQLLYHEVYPLFTFNNSCFNFHVNPGHGYSKAMRFSRSVWNSLSLLWV